MQLEANGNSERYGRATVVLSKTGTETRKVSSLRTSEQSGEADQIGLFSKEGGRGSGPAGRKA